MSAPAPSDPPPRPGPGSADPSRAAPAPIADWSAVRALFDQVADLDPAARAAALDASGASPALRAEVLALLAHADAARTTGAGFLAAPAAAVLPPAGATEPAAPGAAGDRRGQRVGAWRIEALLGRGGMGEVWSAVRDDGAHAGRAAIKVLRAGMDSQRVLARFAQEQRALARLNHPHIAHLLDVARTPDGAPCIVMELVQGRPIDTACAGLPLAQRLALFLQLADAVAHAHRALLVHRDLKPGNVLVTDDGQVKLLDFGIAKALDPLEGADPGATVAGERPYTPQYASPEQVRGEPVGTGTDIYSLGVLLYLLLTGVRPYGRGATSAREAAHSVLHEEPTRPSALSPDKVPALVADAQWMATRRRLRGDLDNILLKALDKRISHRYASVDALAADVRAHLAGFPVSARTATWRYRAGKFIGRNRWGTALATVALAAVLGSSAVAWQQARRAEARFTDLRQLAHAVLFDYHDLIAPLPGATPVRQRLVSDALGYLDRLSADAPRDRGVRREIGTAYRNAGLVQRNGFRRPHLGDGAGALRSYGQSIAALEALVAEDPDDADSAYELALSLSARAGLHAEDRQLPQAEALLGRAAALFTAFLDRDTPDLQHRLELARTHLRIADARLANDRAADARPAIDAARRTLQGLAALQPRHPELPHVWVWVNNVGSFAARVQGDWPTVRQEETEALQRLEALVADRPDDARILEDLAGTHDALAVSAAALGDVAGVERWSRLAVDGWSRAAARDSADRNAGLRRLDVLMRRGSLLVEVGQVRAGLQHLRSITPVVQAAVARDADGADADLQQRGLALQVALAVAASAADGLDSVAACGAWRDSEALAQRLQQRFPASARLRTQAAVMRYQRARLQAQAPAAPADRQAAVQQLAGALDALDALRRSGSLVPTAEVRHIALGRAVLRRLQPGGAP